MPSKVGIMLLFIPPLMFRKTLTSGHSTLLVSGADGTQDHIAPSASGENFNAFG